MAKKPLEEIFNVDGKGEPSQDEAKNGAGDEANDRNGIGSVDNMVAREQLRTIVERVERLAEEKKAISDDITAVYAEASANGFDAKILRQVVALRKKEPTEREEEDATRELYMLALGMLPDNELEGDE